INNVYSYFYYKNIIIDNTNINITPDIIGTDVLLMIFNGLTFNVPATINTTAATGETALNRFPARPIGTLTAIGLIPAASAKGTINGIIAKNNAIPLPLKITMSAVKPTRINGSTKSNPFPCIFSIVCCNVSISPLDCKPATKTEAATKRATTEIILPIPVKNFSVSANTSLLPLWRISSQMIASMKETNTATSTLIEIFEFVVSSTIKETNNRIIGKTGRIAYTVLKRELPSTSSNSFNSTSPEDSSIVAFLSIRFCQK